MKHQHVGRGGEPQGEGGEENRGGEEGNCAVGRKVGGEHFRLVLSDRDGLELALPSDCHNIWILISMRVEILRARECGVKLWRLAHVKRPSRRTGTPGNAI